MVLTSSLLIMFIARLTDDQLAAEVRAALANQSSSIAADLKANGVAVTARDIDAELRLPGSNAVLLVTEDGKRLAGNLATWPVIPIEAAREKRAPARVMLRRMGDPDASLFAVKVHRLDGGFRLLVGRSLQADERLTKTLRTSLFAGLALALGLSGLTAIILTRVITRRVQAIADVATAVAAGDLSRRVDEQPAPGPGDVFDSMVRALNAMLARNEMLIDEIRMVTDGLAHDLRSPLTRLKARIDRLARGGQDQDNEIAAIGAEADALLVMLENCLEISRVEAGIGRDAFTAFDVAALTRDLAEMYEPLAEETGLQLTTDAPVALPLLAHRNLLSRALANMIDNALRYGASGGLIDIAAHATPTGIAISVGDHGPGIASSEHAEAMRRFGRIDSARTTGGVGLGLPLAAAIARLHGGTLKLYDNRPGLRVVIDVPDSAAATAN